MLARLMLCSERGTMTGPWRDSSSVSFNKLPWFRPARKAGIIPALASGGHPRSLRLAAQDTALSRLERGFDSPRERHFLQGVTSGRALEIPCGALPPHVPSRLVDPPPRSRYARSSRGGRAP